MTKPDTGDSLRERPGPQRWNTTRQRLGLRLKVSAQRDLPGYRQRPTAAWLQSLFNSSGQDAQQGAPDYGLQGHRHWKAGF
jgi:hypothetical protein